MSLLFIGASNLSLGDCLSEVEDAAGRIMLGSINPSIPRRLDGPLQLSPEMVALERETGVSFFELNGFTTYQFTAGPASGQTRLIASHTIKTLAANLRLSGAQKASVWRESAKLFQKINPDWAMNEIRMPNGNFLFQGNTPALPTSTELPVIYFTENGEIRTGELERIRDSNAAAGFDLLSLLKKRTP